MPIISLTPALRSLPYFANFKADRVEIPDKPFVRELLTDTLDLGALSIQDLCDCIKTCIYFSLTRNKAVEELLWKIGADGHTFNEWFTNSWEKWHLKAMIPVPLGKELNIGLGETISRSRLIKLGIRCLDPTCLEIVSEGNLRLLKWLNSLMPYGPNGNKPFWYDIRDYPGNEAEDPDCSRHIHKSGCICNKFTARAAEKGYLDCLRYLHEQGCPWNEKALEQATLNGRLECLKYLCEQGCPFPCYTSLAVYAALMGQLTCLKYLHERGCPWDEQVTEAAASTGNLACLRYLHERGCPWDVRTTTKAAMYGHLDCLQYAHEKGCPWDEYATMFAAKEGQLECLQYLHEKGCPWGEIAPAGAAKTGQLACIKYLHERGCPWNILSTINAAENGHWKCLKYLHEQDCPWDERVTKYAVEKDHYTCLKYLRDHGCPE